MTDAPPPLQTLETRLERIEKVLEGIHLALQVRDKSRSTWRKDLEEGLNNHLAGVRQMLVQILESSKP